MFNVRPAIPKVLIKGFALSCRLLLSALVDPVTASRTVLCPVWMPF